MAMYCSPEYQTSFKSVGLLVQKKLKIDFQDGGCGGQLGFLIITILAILDLQITPIILTQASSQLAFWFRRRKSK